MDGSLECVRVLLGAGCDSGVVNNNGYTPLGLAVKNERLKVVKYLTTEQNIDLRDMKTFDLAVESRSRDLVKCLKPAALSLACCEGDVNRVESLINKYNCDPKGVVNKDGLTPLRLAVQNGKLEVVNYLIVEQNVDLKDLKTFDLAVESRNRDLVDCLKPSALSLACREGDVNRVQSLINKYNCDPKGVVDSDGHTPLGLAVQNGKLKVVKYLIAEQNIDPKGVVDSDGHTPLGLAIQNGKLKVMNYLITEQNIDPKGVVDSDGHTPLGLAVQNGKLEVVEYLITEQHIDPKGVVDKDGLTPLRLAVQNGKLEVVNYLIVQQNVGLKDMKTFDLAVESRNRDLVECLKPSALSLACREGDVNRVESLINKYNCDPKEALFLACKHGNKDVTRYLLVDMHSDPNISDKDGRTALSLASSKEVIQLLLQHGAVADNAYKLQQNVLGNLFSKDPLENPVKLFVTGLGGDGKSTLIEAMQLEPTIFTPFKAVFIPPKEVDGVSQRTAGIIPKVFNSEIFGPVQFFDFAGQEAFYSSHAALIRSTVDACPPVFLLVTGMHNDHDTLSHSVSYWLGIVQNQCTSMKGKAPLIIVGSHEDVLKERGEDPEIKKQLILQSVQKFSDHFELIDFILMDCRYSNSVGMKQLRRSTGTACVSLRERLSIALNAHMFLVYLLDKFPGVVAVMLKEVQSRIETDRHDPSKKLQRRLSFVPTTQRHLVEICVQLSDKGHLLFLHNTVLVEESFIVIDKTALLKEVNGAIFAPKDFKQHCKLASSTGVVPRSKLVNRFLKFNVEMVIGFYSHLELCLPIDDKEVLSLIQQQVANTTEQVTPAGESYLFFPALIRLEAPERVWEFQSDLTYHFGWRLACSMSGANFDIRFFQVLLLRLALSLRLALNIDESVPSLQRICSVWKRGVCWCTNDGITSLVELDIRLKAVAVQMRSRTLTPACLKLRSQVINKVRDAAKEFCSAISTVESLIDPTDAIQYPMKPSSELSLYHLKHVAESVVQCKADVLSTFKTVPMDHLLRYEVYSDLGEDILQLICNGHEEKVSDEVITALSRTSSRLPGMDVVIRGTSDGTYRSLRGTLAQYSVFSGRSPLELAGVPLIPFSEVTLPVLTPSGADMNLLSQQPSLHAGVSLKPFPEVTLPVPTVVMPTSDLDLTSVDNTTRLGEDDITEIIKELSSLKSNYYLLGLGLHLPPGRVDQIQVDNPHKSETAFGQVIVQWLLMNYNHVVFGPPSWQLLVKAVDTIDHQLAKQIASNHQRAGLQ